MVWAGFSNAYAAPISNTATGMMNGSVLDLSNATVSLNSTGGGSAVTSVLAEISPNAVGINSIGQAFIYDVLPTINVGDTGLNQVAITAPAGYNNLSVSGVSVGGTSQVVGTGCPTLNAGEYCGNMTGQVMTVTLGTPVTGSLTALQFTFSVDVPSTLGAGDFTAMVDDTTTITTAQTVTAGDADGDTGDLNSLNVSVRAIDVVRSLVSATPLLLEIDRDGDGNPFSTITIIPRDPSNVDLGSNLNVVVSVIEAALPSAKPSGVKQAPGDPFGVLSPVLDHGDGTYSTQLSSSVSGILSISTTVNGVLLQSVSTVTFTAGQVLKISKTANKKSGVIGDIITYEVAIQNTTTQDVSSVTLNDKVPPGFKYLRGSTLINGQTAGDPTGNQTRAFNLGTIAAWVDQNGNGLADTGDLGNMTLSYQLVIGSGVKPGDHINRAQAVDFAAISNQASVKVRVNSDPIFDLGTLIGKVFFDKNKNGYQDRREVGIGAAQVVLDNGTYVITDDHGRFHFPGVRPGQRLLKINTATLPPGTTVTTEEARIVEVSRGLLTKVNFGVVYDIETEHIGRPGKRGIAVAPKAEIEPTQITGHLDAMQLLVNGERVNLPLNQAYLGLGRLQETVEMVGERLSRAIPFSIKMGTSEAVKQWRLEIHTENGALFRVLQAEGAPPEEILWDGKNAEGRLMEGGAIYVYQFKIDYKDGSSESSAKRLFGVNKTSAISLSLLGSAFEVGSVQIGAKTEEALHSLAETLKKYPDERITIEGHTDNTGSETSNLELSKARAEAAMHYLIEKKGINKKRFSLKWFGEEKPIASNHFEEGRSVNRRVEIVGAIQEVKKAKILSHPRSEAVMSVNGVPVQVDEDERFSVSLGNNVDSFVFEMSSSQGEVVKTRLVFPKLSITAPAEKEILNFGERNERYLALPLPKGDKKTAGLPVASYRLQGVTGVGNQVWVDGKHVKLLPSGIFETDILLKIGENVFTIVVNNAQQLSRMMTLKIDLSDKDEQGRIMMALKPIPQISVLLPPKDKVLSHIELPLRGMTDPGNQVWVNQEQIVVQENGTFSASAQLKQGKNTLVIEVRDPEGFTSQIERELLVENAPFFLMALADGEFGQITTSGYLEGAGADKAKDYYSKGRLAYYLKGKILGKYLMTSAFDTGKNEFDQMFQDLDQAETERFFTNIDPDKFYPVYGDESTVVYDAQTQGKFYLAIEGEDLNVLVGNYKTDFNETELAVFNRTFYGGRFEYRSLSKSPYGAHDTKVVVFAAQVRQVHVQNTFRATGGSLYYLSEKEIIEGSEQVRLEIRDQETGLVLAQIDQVRDADYSFKYEEGRILFRRPISSVASNDLLLRQESLQGHPVFVLVDFEYEAQSFDKKSLGARVRQHLGDHLAVGGTVIEDAAESGDYELRALDAEVRFGEGTTVVGEYAESKGKNSATLISDDGGLSFTPITTAAVGTGEAYKVAVRSDISEWFGGKDRLVSNVYYKRLSPEFFSNGTLLEQGTLKYGGGIKAVLSKRDVLRFRYDFQEVIANGNLASANQVGAKQVIVKEIEYDHRRGPFLFTAGLQDKQIDDTAGLSKVEQQLAGRVDWIMSERISTSIRHQQLIQGPEAYRTTFGLKVGFTDWLDGVAEGAHARDGDTALLGFSARLDERSTIYANETLDKKQGQDATWGSVVGGDRLLTQGLKLYGEYGQERGNVNQIRSLWGLNQGFGDQKKLKINLNYERSRLKGITQNTRRESVSMGLRYRRPDGSRLAHRIEVRFEKAADRKIQRLMT
ncbi:OmpA family protein, partial [Nitrospira defluvii]|nr:OmpA family protein [Nitrospira defluvii]